MKHKSFFILFLITGIVFTLTNLTALGQQESTYDVVADILADFEPESLNQENARAIQEAFREQGLQGGPDLDEAIRAAGFDAAVLRDLAPPPSDTERSPKHKNSSTKAKVKIYECLNSEYMSSDFKLESIAVENGKLLDKYKCERKDNGCEKSIPLHWTNVPDGTGSLAVVMYHFPEPDDRTRVNSYLLLWGINPAVTEIPYGTADSPEWYMGRNKDGDSISYTSPCSQGSGSHEYVISLFALAEYPGELPKENSLQVDFSTLMDAIEGSNILGKAQLVFVDETIKELSGNLSDRRNSEERPEREPDSGSGQRSKPGSEKKPGRDQGQQYSVSQAVSDNAQLHTIAFDALAFFTGNASADTFYPPGKVSDFFGFQYFRDIDEGSMGHNTTFVPRVANNILSVLGDLQIQKLIDLAQEQTELVTAYGYGRYPLMIAFRKNLEKEFPSGTAKLDRDSVIKYSSELYRIDGELSYNRARVLGEILHSLTDVQKARFDEMAEGSSATWGFPDDQVDKSTMPHATHVLVMTYASEMFTWYAGNVENDTYFCPERHGTYYGGFYMKDAPVMDDPDFFIDIDATGGSGASMLKILTSEQADRITSLVDLQREDLEDLVKIRRQISEKLRLFMKGQTADEKEIMSLMSAYGEIDGKINYLYASTFAEVYQDLSQSQRDDLSELRLSEGFEPASGYLFAEPVEYPKDIAYEFMFR